MVIVDSDVWSEAFRKQRDLSRYVSLLRGLIESEEVLMIALIRQEVLSGIREKEKFEVMRDALRAFPNQNIDDSIYELAASFFNCCRSKGIQGSHTDYLICACAVSWKVKILSKDKDFARYAKYLPIELMTAE